MIVMEAVCFTEANLFSKKQLVFHDDVMNYAEIPLHIINALLFIDMYKRSKTVNLTNKCITLAITSYLADLLSALFHSYVVDRNNNPDNIYIDKHTRQIVINTTNGYSTAHHIFPSNWKDINDAIIMRDGFTLLLPLFVMNYLNTNDTSAYFNYLLLYQLVFSSVAHKYAHERNHNRYVPEIIKMLQDLGLSLSGKEHKKHHEQLHSDYAFYNGWSNKLTNKIIEHIDYLFDIKQSQDEIDICKKYIRKYGKDIHIKFKGDIEGEIVVNLHGNIVKMKKPNI